jgi:lysine 2,3-aminomutase
LSICYDLLDMAAAAGPVVPISEKRAQFRTRYFLEASDKDWCNWRWQQRNVLKSLAEIERIVALSGSEREAILRRRDSLPFGVTPYYASLVEEDVSGPIRRTVLPLEQEFVPGPGELRDPLAEDAQSPVPGIVHRYRDRVLFLVTSLCPTYCRYCTRSRAVGNFTDYHFNREQWRGGIRYIRQNTAIRDVLLSGGDPLSLADAELDWLIGELSLIPHLELIRIGTKIPAVLPQRVTPELVGLLRRIPPVWLSVHFMHPAELTAEAAAACSALADAGIPLMGQTVLIRDVNDSVQVLEDLFRGLLRLRVKPYYLYQCDPVLGTSHFRTPVTRGLQIMRELRGRLSGYGIPTYVVDTPGGGGKVPLYPEAIRGREGADLLIENFEGRVFRYPDPVT